jgi:hypothetical protein
MVWSTGLLMTGRWCYSGPVRVIQQGGADCNGWLQWCHGGLTGIAWVVMVFIHLYVTIPYIPYYISYLNMLKHSAVLKWKYLNPRSDQLLDIPGKQYSAILAFRCVAWCTCVIFKLTGTGSDKICTVQKTVLKDPLSIMAHWLHSCIVFSSLWIKVSLSSISWLGFSTVLGKCQDSAGWSESFSAVVPRRTIFTLLYAWYHCGVTFWSPCTLPLSLISYFLVLLSLSYC